MEDKGSSLAGGNQQKDPMNGDNRYPVKYLNAPPATLEESTVEKRIKISKTVKAAHLQFLDSATLTDFAFIVGATRNKFQCHSVFLAARSTKLREIIIRGTREIELQDCDASTVHQFLKFIYADIFEPTTVTIALNLLELGVKFDVELLIEKCLNKLSSEMNPLDAVKAFKVAEAHGLEELRDCAGDILVESLPSQVEGSLLWDMDESIMKYLLDRDDLNIKEVELFQLLLKWGKLMIKEPENIEKLQKSLVLLVPKIRFPTMTLEEFASSVVPAARDAKLLPDDTIIQLFTFFASASKKDTSLPFPSLPRSENAQEQEKIVTFYKAQTGVTEKETTAESSFLLQHIRFSITHRSRTLKITPDGKSKRTLLTGIILQWPEKIEEKAHNTQATIHKTEDAQSRETDLHPQGSNSNAKTDFSFTPKLTFGTSPPFFASPPNLSPVSAAFTKPGQTYKPSDSFKSNAIKARAVPSVRVSGFKHTLTEEKSLPISSTTLGPTQQAHTLFRITVTEITKQVVRGHPPLDPKFQVKVPFKCGSIAEVPLKPGVELRDGFSYAILVEELGIPPLKVKYRQRVTGQLENSCWVKFRKFGVKIGDIVKNDRIPYATSPFADMELVKGIKLKAEKDEVSVNSFPFSFPLN